MSKLLGICVINKVRRIFAMRICIMETEIPFKNILYALPTECVPNDIYFHELSATSKIANEISNDESYALQNMHQ